MQGFSAALIPVGISIMRDELPKERVSSAVALMSATLGIGGALGLPLGGILFQRFGWASVFWLSAVVGIAILIAVLVVVRESEVRTRAPFDILGAALLSVALTALLLVISKGGRWGWGSERTILLVIVTAVMLAIWVPYSLRVNHPLVDLRTSARRPILLTNIASILVGFTLMDNMLVSAQQLQQPVAGSGFGMSAVSADMAMVPSGLAMVAFSPISGAMINRYGGRLTLMVGSLITAFGYVGRVSPPTPRSAVVEFSAQSAPETITLLEPLMLTGQVRRGGSPQPGAIVTLSAHTGEFRAGTTTDAEGRYRLRLPPPGHNILTVLEPRTLQAQSTKIFTTTQSAVADVDLLVEREPDLLPG